ncbi:uncharacterized protein LOC131245291 [Magnolia sinica]|uniref:uncharacterized protein LOC131245291 n=1 Tax=Magnolia sinica TaxID=86752 RepID=UPI00265B5C85|nr:uncharacterized protein LOC131245291 [Magnolia sinica]
MSCEVEDPCGSYSTCKDERVGAAELMDEYWFFHNMLDRARIFKPSTDACCSSTNKEMLLQDKHGGLQSPPRNLPKHDNPSNAPNFLRTPSLPPCIGKEKSIQCEDINGRSSTNSRLQRSFSSVANAPSPPPIANSHCSSSSKSTTLKPGIPRR